MNEQRNVILAVVLSIAILIGWQAFLLPTPEEVQQQIASGESVDTTPRINENGTITHSISSDAAVMPREDVIAQDIRITIDTPRLSGSLRTKGARLDDVVLKDHKLAVEEGSDNVVLFAPRGAQNPYYAEFGWSISGSAEQAMPDTNSIWATDGTTLTPDSPITLTWSNGTGLTFTRTISIDPDYMITVNQSVTNKTNTLVNLFPYGLINRTGTPSVSGMFILHEGLLGVFNETLNEVDYDDVRDEAGGKITELSTGGWIGITDKYWLAALIPDQTRRLKGTFTYTQTNSQDFYQSDYLFNDGIAIAPDTTESVTNRLFVGAKQVNLLDRYAEDLGIINFDLAVDFGWFYWITKPLFHVIHYFFELMGNFGIAIIFVTFLIKLAFFPLANTSYRAMSKMRKLQPRMQEMREKHGDNRQAISQDMMTLYRKEKVNPMAGCLPILLQIPVFFALYKVLFVTIEMRHAPFYGWITDLSAPDPTTFWNLFGLIPWDAGAYIPDFLMVGVLPLIMGVTMYLQQKLNPQPMEEIQKRIFQIMPIFFTFLLATFPAGLVIYWIINNILSILQQWVIMKRDHSI